MQVLTWTINDTLLPFDLPIIRNSSHIDLMPELIVSSEELSGVDGAVPVITKYGTRAVDLVIQSPFREALDRDSINEIKREMGRFMQSIKGEDVEIKSERMNASIYARLEGMPEVTQRYAGWIELKFLFTAYDPYIYESSFRRFSVADEIINNGDLEAYPDFEFDGPLTNPFLTLNGIVYTYTGTIAAGERIVVDNYNRDVRLIEASGKVQRRNGNWCGLYSQLNIGKNKMNINPAYEGKVNIKWRPRFIVWNG